MSDINKKKAVLTIFFWILGDQFPVERTLGLGGPSFQAFLRLARLRLRTKLLRHCEPVLNPWQRRQEKWSLFRRLRRLFRFIPLLDNRVRCQQMSLNLDSRARHLNDVQIEESLPARSWE